MYRRTTQRLEIIEDMLKDNPSCSWSDIGKKLGISRSAAHALYTYRERDEKKSIGRSRVRLKFAKIAFLLSQGHTSREVSKILNVQVQLVRRVARKFRLRKVGKRN